MPWIAFFLGYLIGFFTLALLVAAREETRAWRGLDDEGAE